MTAGVVNTLSTYPADMASTSVVTVAEQLTMTYSSQGYVSAGVHYMGLGNTVDTDANGKVCIIDRVEVTFDEKVLNCENSGGLAAVVVNNVDGILNGTLGEATTSSIPAAGAALSARDQLMTATSVTVDLEWINATARKVDVYRNGTIISATGNDGT